MKCSPETDQPASFTLNQPWPVYGVMSWTWQAGCQVRDQLLLVGLLSNWHWPREYIRWPELTWFWLGLFFHPGSLLSNSAMDLICNHGSTQLVREPTEADNISDVILCSDVLSCDNVGCLSPLDLSHHSIQSTVSFASTLSFRETVDDFPHSPCPNFNLADWASSSLFQSHWLDLQILQLGVSHWQVV